MKSILLTFISIICLLDIGQAQQKKAYTPRIEPGDCAFKPKDGLKTRCGYLIVPENRKKPKGKTIKLPFIYVESDRADKKKDPILYTSGGPGGSSLGAVQGIRKGMLDRDYIAFEQRGTKYAIPQLESNELEEAIKKAYREGLPKDSMVMEGLKTYRKKFTDQGIDLSAYNTLESAADIDDLLSVLKVDSVNLFGISYSGGLMLTVLKYYPSRIRSMVLDSPLPEFVNIDEDEIANFNSALNTVFVKCATDSTDKTLYGSMKEKFHTYFTAIEDKVFSISYIEKATGKTLSIKYGRNELLDVLENTLFDYRKIKDIPYIINNMIKGEHGVYIHELMDNVFNGSAPSAMRLSVYCSDKMAYANDAIIQQQYKIYPYLSGYHINDVYRKMCNCWNVTPIPEDVKKPFYSNVPVLLGGGDTDPACSPLYNDIIHHYMPNSQRLLFINRSHGPMLSQGGFRFIFDFLNNPYKKIISDDKSIIAY